MKEKMVLFLTSNPNSQELYEWIRKQCSTLKISDPITVEDIQNINPDLIISYNYKHIVKKDVIDLMKNRIINMHISYLPWNRGANPNFWSFIDDTPKGVTIHIMDEGLDTGDILYQKEIEFDVNVETLASSYERLQNEIVDLLKEHWNDILDGQFQPQKQIGIGSYHSILDFKKICEKISFSWDDLVLNVVEQYRNIIDAK